LKGNGDPWAIMKKKSQIWFDWIRLWYSYCTLYFLFFGKNHQKNYMNVSKGLINYQEKTLWKITVSTPYLSR
jgi:hypothetical protein